MEFQIAKIKCALKTYAYEGYRLTVSLTSSGFSVISGA